MKRSKLIISLIVVGLICIITGSSILVYNNISNSKKRAKEDKELIVSSHGVFKTEIEAFNEARSNYYNDVASDLFVESIEDYDKWIEVIDAYTKTIDNVEAKSKNLKNLCINRYYGSIDIKNKCDSFVIAYETAVNYYTKDIIEFNENIKKFNNSLSDKKEEYKLNYEYTDINDDGKYFGKD